MLFTMIGFLPTLFASAAEVPKRPQAVLETSKGKIVIELYSDKAPVTVKNFISYAKAGFYNGTVFHRVIPGFMIQGGGFPPDMGRKETNAPIKNEADNGLKNERGTVAMARTPDPHSATAQFFINLVNNEPLNHTGKDNWGYAVFGKVVTGMEAVDSIAKVQTGTRGPHRDVPVEPVIIQKVEIVEP